MLRRAACLGWFAIAACGGPTPPPGIVSDPSGNVTLCASAADCAPGERCENGLCTDAVAPPRDGGTPDTGVVEPAPDAGVVDAGEEARDGGPRDGGVSPRDAGPRDAGPRDAGPVAPSVDLSGWIIENREHAPVIQSYTFPAGTVLAPGQHLLLVRGVDRAAFEADLGVDLAAHLFIRTNAQSNGVPIVNGAESWALVDARGDTVDGPTVAGAIATSYRRKDSGDAVDPAHWVIGGEVDDVPGTSLMTASDGVRICQWSDESGTGRYVFEYVELCYQP